ncbi:hypothetical protein [Zavarzinella formosa]|uniref:hypothetical protein n=1 Tax=Zavarzinella formosa TaxID=360055 RepID=UPI0002D84FAE|nr:hypothetical protein [Zavarzinella formosa]
MRRIGLLASLLMFAGSASTTFGQQIIQFQPEPQVILGTPMSAPGEVIWIVPAPAPYPPAVLARHPRLQQSLQILADPSAYFFGPTEGVEFPTRHPFIDAAPNIVNIASIGLFFGGGPALVALAFALPPAIRAARVVIYGSPVAGPPKDTLLWIAEPSLLRLRNRIRDRRNQSQPVVTSYDSYPYGYGYGGR